MSLEKKNNNNPLEVKAFSRMQVIFERRLLSNHKYSEIYFLSELFGSERSIARETDSELSSSFPSFVLILSVDCLQ